MKDYLNLEEANSIIRELFNTNKYDLSLLVFISINTGMRISDILALKWADIIDKEVLYFKESKTLKVRRIFIKDDMRFYIEKIYKMSRHSSINDYCFMSQKHCVYTVQRINQILKKVAIECNIKDVTITTHTLRKTFGRELYKRTDGMALNNLVEYFSHPSPNFTLEYLQIEKKDECILLF